MKAPRTSITLSCHTFLLLLPSPFLFFFFSIFPCFCHKSTTFKLSYFVLFRRDFSRHFGATSAYLIAESEPRYTHHSPKTQLWEARQQARKPYRPAVSNLYVVLSCLVQGRIIFDVLDRVGKIRLRGPTGVQARLHCADKTLFPSVEIGRVGCLQPHTAGPPPTPRWSRSDFSLAKSPVLKSATAGRIL